MLIFIILLTVKIQSEELVLIDKVIGTLDGEPFLLSEVNSFSHCSLAKEVLRRKGKEIDLSQFESIVESLKALNPRINKKKELIKDISLILAFYGKDLVDSVTQDQVFEIFTILAPSVKITPSESEKMNLSIYSFKSEEEFQNFLKSRVNSKPLNLKHEEIEVAETSLDLNVWQVTSILLPNHCSVPLFGNDDIVIFCVNNRTRKLTLDTLPRELVNVAKMLAVANSLAKSGVEEKCKSILTELGFEFLNKEGNNQNTKQG